MKRTRVKIRSFSRRVLLEARETRAALKLLKRQTRGDELSEEEERALKSQMFDVVKIVAVGIPFLVIPGASIVLTVLIVYLRRRNINILPSSFDDKAKISK